MLIDINALKQNAKTGLFGYLALESIQIILRNIHNAHNKEQLKVDQELFHWILETLQSHTSHRKIVLVSCHIISNIALNSDHALSMIEMNAAIIVCDILKKYQSDSRVVWKAASALWNLCRPVTDNTFVPECAVEVVFNCMINNPFTSKSGYTTLGALANLALVRPDETRKCMTRANREKLALLMHENHTKTEICSSFGALVANMSVIRDLGEACIQEGYVELLVLCILQGELNHDEAKTHVIAALHNLSDLDGFASQLCLCNGVEILRAAQDAWENVCSLVDDIFQIAQISSNALTSLQAAVVSCDMFVLTNILHDPLCDVNAMDNEGKTACDIACEFGFDEKVNILVACGGSYDPTTLDDLSEIDYAEIADSIRIGKSLHKRSRKIMNSVLKKESRYLITDVSTVIIDFLSGIDMLKVLA